MQKHVCVICQFKCEITHIGVAILEQDANNKDVALWMANVYRCPRCLYQIYSDFAETPITKVGDRLWASWKPEAVGKMR